MNVIVSPVVHKVTVTPSGITVTSTPINLAASPAGLTGYIQYNAGGVFGGYSASQALNAILPAQGGQGGKVLGTNGSAASWVTGGGGGGTPGGSSGQVQWNSGGAFAGAGFSAVATSGDLLSLTAQVDTDLPLLVRGHSLQSANLQEWRRADDVPLCWITPAGVIHGDGSGLSNLSPLAISAGTAGISISGNAATATNGVVTTGSYANPSWITGLAGAKITGNVAGSAGGLTVTLGIAGGGTGQVTQQAAIDALVGTQSAGKYLRSDGTHSTLAAIQAADVPVLNQNTTGTAAGLSATLGTGSGGTGLAATGTADQILGVVHTGTGLEYKTLTAGSNITITPAAGSITIAASGGAPGGSTGLLQFNNAGAFGGAAGLSVDATGKYLSLAGGTLPASGASQALSVTATMGASASVNGCAVLIDVTGAGTSNSINTAARIVLEAGYTGGNQSRAGIFENYSAGSGNRPVVFAEANYGFYAYCAGVTTGANVACFGQANSGKTNFGTLGRANETTNSPTNQIGCAGFAANGTNNVAGFFGLYPGGSGSEPSYTSAALVADNGATGAPILIGRNNGSAVVTILGDGSLQPPTIADSAASNNSIYFSSTAGKLVYKDSGGTVHALY